MESKDDVKHHPTVNHAQTSSSTLIKNLGKIKPTLSYERKHSSYIKNHYFPDSLLLEILYRVPVKSTFRFNCVSKHWLSLISDLSFKRNHHSRLRDSPLWTLHYRFLDGIIHNIPNEYNKVNFVTSKHFMFNSPDFPFTFISSVEQQHHQRESKKFHVAASSNDLLLIYRRCVYYVCNPFTKQWIALPCVSKSSQGLGFISQTKNGFTHYKVVLIANYSRSTHPESLYRTGYDIFQLDIFSSESGKWRKSEISLPGSINLETPLMGAVTYNGILHWIDNASGIIIAYKPFDDGNECFFFELPIERENWRMGGLNGVLAVCQGHLRYFEIASIFLKPGEFESWSVWVLKDYATREWRLEPKGRDRIICSSFDPHPDLLVPQRTFIPIASHPLDMDIMYFWCKGGYILSFNLRRGWFEDEIYRIPDAGLVCWWTVFSIEVFPSPTLVPPPCWKTTTVKMVERTKIGTLWRLLKLYLKPFCNRMTEN